MLIVGLGNPGKKYQLTRHNAGRIALMRLFQQLEFKPDKKLKGLVSKGKWNRTDIVLLMPESFMNLSGDSVQPALNYFKIKLEDVIVLHDEIDLPEMDIKYKFDGGHRGHNGLRDIIEKCGGGGFHRIRIGVGRPLNQAISVADHVLSDFSPMPEFPMGKISSIMDTVINGKIPAE